MSIFGTDGYSYFEDSLKLLIVLLVIFSLVLLTPNLITGNFSFKSMESHGSVEKINVGVYWDRNCSTSASSIDWGNIEPGSVKNVSVFIRNEGTVAADLFLSTDNWSPSNASEFMTLSWDYNGQTLDPFELVFVTMTLQVSSSVERIQNFHFDIIIAATD